jgi:5-enolpyruvylshikimate-3-phosphate synthase
MREQCHAVQRMVSTVHALACSGNWQVNSGVAIDTYDDHRMAMAFSLAACAGVPVTINDPGCTRKTFPTYFKVLESVAQH